MKTLRSNLAALLFAALAAFVTAARADPLSYQDGQLSAVMQASAVARTSNVLATVIQLRTMANINRVLGQLFFFAGDFSISLYFQGRASAFDGLADLYEGAL